MKPLPASLEKSFKLAERAVELDPQNARALQALMLANVFRNDIQSALRAGAAAYAINANDTEVAGEYGLRLAMSGKWDTGCGLVSNAVSKGRVQRVTSKLAWRSVHSLRGPRSCGTLVANVGPQLQSDAPHGLDGHSRGLGPGR